MDGIWLWVFIVSTLMFVFVMIRSKLGLRWLSAIALNAVLAAVLLYFAELAEPYTRVDIPINVVTVATVAVLGVPGILMLAALKWVLF
ncbi:pro-sigmaK processing inhibitor BofA family protein [Paenibacillus alkalitolerans]|uniref:pro-sigmaK processing inhibitor BofA family protein n=1 Tax=Paenibacillus alkalitolerans TaxID=2799335 RepID=UPI0018F39FA2|nr:pro-sigmaK processing inhibitor BofA family protein [Paenibacillus alkalitolerans]